MTIMRAIPPKTPPKIAPTLAPLLHSVAERHLGQPEGQSKLNFEQINLEKYIYQHRHWSHYQDTDQRDMIQQELFRN